MFGELNSHMRFCTLSALKINIDKSSLCINYAYVAWIIVVHVSMLQVTPERLALVLDL